MVTIREVQEACAKVCFTVDAETFGIPPVHVTKVATACYDQISALKFEEVSAEPVAWGVSSINAIDGSVGWDFIADFEQAAHDHINDQIIRFQDAGLEVDEMHVVPLYTTPQPCPRCAELEQEVSDWRNNLYTSLWKQRAEDRDKTIESQRLLLMDLRGQVAALEAENKRLKDCSERCQRCESMIVHELKITIAQQAEQLAAAEKDAARYRWLRVNNIIANIKFHYANGESPYVYAEVLDESIDVAIAEGRKHAVTER